MTNILFLTFIIGITFGILAGILPGIHTNTLQSIVLALHLPIESEHIAILLASMAFSRLAFEAVPAILLFVPDEETVVSMLPGHRLAHEGKAGMALNIYAFSTVASAAFASLLLPISLACFPLIYSALHPFTSLALALACIAMVFSEPGFLDRFFALVCILVSGALGWASFNSGLNDPFLPAFTGMFAIPAAIFALNSKTSNTNLSQQNSEFKASRLLPLIFIGSVLGALADLFPGMGSAAQIGLLVSFLVPFNSEGFLAFTAAISSSHLLFSLAASSSIGKARTGAAAAIASVLGGLESNDLMMLVGTALISISISSAFLHLFSKRIAEEFGRFDHQFLNISMLAFLPLLVYFTEGIRGLILLGAASAAGAMPLLAGCKRVHLMGFIIIPALANSLIN